MTLDGLIKEYRKSPSYKKLSLGSFRSYEYAIRILEQYFRGRKLVEIRRSDVIKLVNQMSDKPASANLVLRVASVLFSFAVDVDEMPYNPTTRLKKLKTGSHVRWYPDEVRKAIAVGDRIVSVAVALAWYTGQRESDILGLQWKDLKDGYINLVQTKTGVEMGIKVHPDLANLLASLRNGEPDHNFIVSGPRMLTGQAFRMRFRRMMERIGIEKTFHGIRKGVASSLAESGRSTTEIAAILGHKTTRMAEYYAEQACGKKMAANAVDNMTGCI